MNNWEDHLDEYLYSQTIGGRQEYEEEEEEREEARLNAEDYYEEDARERYYNEKYNQD
jgi:hypothetical protein